MKLEDYIKSRVPHQDIATPPDDMWQKINERWEKPKPKRTLNMWKYAAILFIASSLGLTVYSLSLQNQVDKLISLGDISKEYQQLEDAYKQEISELENQVSLTQVSQSEDLGWLVDELNTLDRINEEYRQDTGVLVDEEQLVGVLIDYYEKRIRILKKLELEIRRTGNEMGVEL